MIVNASPLICLSKGGLLDLLPALFKEIVVPAAVIQEIMRKGVIDPPSKDLSSHKWLKQVDTVAVNPSVVSWDLGEGESSVLSFALRNPQFLAIIDDREARRCAVSLSCRYTGTVGLIVLAKQRGIVPSVRESLKRLRDSGLWLSEVFIRDICRKANEG